MIEIKVDTDKITVDDLILIEEAGDPERKVKLANIRDFLARFAVIKPFDLKEAKKEIGKLTFKEMMEVIEQVGKQFEEQQNPPVSDGQ